LTKLKRKDLTQSQAMQHHCRSYVDMTTLTKQGFVGVIQLLLLLSCRHAQSRHPRLAADYLRSIYDHSACSSCMVHFTLDTMRLCRPTVAVVCARHTDLYRSLERELLTPDRRHYQTTCRINSELLKDVYKPGISSGVARFLGATGVQH